MCSCFTENVFNGCCNDCCNTCCNGCCCPKRCCCACLCHAELPDKEEKFSNMILPSFLSDRFKSTKSKGPSCKCLRKGKNASKECKCKDKGIDACDLGNEVCQNACDMSTQTYNFPKLDMGMGKGTAGVALGTAGVGIGTAGVGMGTGGGGIGTAGVGLGTAGVGLSTAGVGLGTTGVGLSTAGMGMGKGAGLADMPAAGLPSKTVPPFNPCTGAESCAEAPPMTMPFMPCQGAMVPMAMPLCYWPNYQFCPNPGGASGTASDAPQEPGAPWETNAADKVNINDMDSNNQNNSDNNKKNKDKEKSKERPAKSQARAQVLSTKDQATKPKPKSKDKGENRSYVNPDLLERICNTLQVPHPPESCYILMPLTMAAKPTNPEQSVEADGNQEPGKDKQAAKQDAKKDAIPNNSCRPTRNCGCNTLISGNISDRSENKGEAPANGCGSCCTPGCCYRPRCSYYYNPYTGCYYWCNNCYCYNGCCNSPCNGCTNSCSIPPRGQTTKPKPDAGKTKSTPSTPKQSNENRIVAGAVEQFQPEMPEFYQNWMCANYNQPPSMPASPLHSGPITYPPQFPYSRIPQQEHNVKRFRSRSPAKQTASDLDWTPV